MTGNDVYEILNQKGIKHLYHANSIITSTSLLKLNGLASRKLVEESGLPQTNQYTDLSDKALGVWGDIFLDTVDIHKRASRSNHYGPVLFALNSEILKSADIVLITKSNPSKWQTHTPNDQRYFTTYDELKEGCSIGNFDHMITLRTQHGLLQFDNYLEHIVIDDPVSFDSPSNEFRQANDTISKLTKISIIRRQCPQWCKCKTSYMDSQLFSKMYGTC